MLELPFCPVCPGRADTSLSFFVGTSEICRHGTRAKTTKIFSGCSGPKYWATKQIVIKWPKKAPPLPPRLWEFSQPGGLLVSGQATHQHRARGRTLMAACLQWSQYHGRTSSLQTMHMGGVAYKDSLDQICLITFFASFWQIFALDHFWHLIYFDFNLTQKIWDGSLIHKLFIVWWLKQKRPWSTAHRTGEYRWHLLPGMCGMLCLV